MSDLILSPLLPKNADLAALKKDRPLMRWAAQSARISSRGHAPDLLGVGLEELVEEPAAEAVHDPLLERVLLALGRDPRPQVGEERLGQVDRPQLLDHVRAAQRIVQELVVPVDPRHARALQELLAHDLVPEVVDLLHLGEEAVAAEVEAVAVAHGGLGDAADLVLGLEHHHGQALLREQVARREPGGAAPEDHRGLVAHVGPREVCRRLWLRFVLSHPVFSYMTPRTPMRVARR